MLHQHRPSQHPDEHPGSSALRYVLLHRHRKCLQEVRPVCVPSDVQHVRSCPIDCASIYYNGVRRSGLYTIVPSLAAMPLEVYCDMDTDGEPAQPN